MKVTYNVTDGRELLDMCWGNALRVLDMVSLTELDKVLDAVDALYPSGLDVGTLNDIISDIEFVAQSLGYSDTEDETAGDIFYDERSDFIDSYQEH